MNLKEIFKKRYKIVRESEAFMISLLVHGLILVAMTFVVITGSEKIIKTLTFQKEKKVLNKPPPPKPVVLPKNLELSPPAPKTPKLQKIDNLLVIKNKPKFKLKTKTLKIRKPKKIEYKKADMLGKSIRTKMNSAYASKFGVEGYGSGLRAKIEQFVVVKYKGGDWDCEFYHGGGKIHMEFGSIPNLITEIERRTNIDVVQKVPVVVEADSKEIHKSPFVYFTGHNDFVLTPAEVENLRTYIIQGGAIVANSALPGRRSRFDIAFRREMKRVMPNYELTPIDSRHDVYKAFPAYTFIDKPPVGMNYWREPLETISINNRVAVIYNLNDYGELMLAMLEDGGETIKKGEAEKPKNYHYQGHMITYNPNRVFANVDDIKTINDAYMMNVNILAYLLTR